MINPQKSDPRASVDSINDIAEPPSTSRRGMIWRRAFLTGCLALGAGGLFAAERRGNTPLPRTSDGLKIVRLSLPVEALCVAPLIMAQEQGLYRKHGLSVEFTNWTETHFLLESVATGKVDAGAGMIMQFIKPLEQGFDLRLVAGTHGGCMRLVGSRRLGITHNVRSLRGKQIGIADASGYAYNTFALLLKDNGIDPLRDVTWRVYPAPLLEGALEKGVIDAYAGSDPLMFMAQKRSDGDQVDILSNLSQPWTDRVCCVIAASGALLRRDRSAVTSLVSAMMEASETCADDPERVARAFLRYGAAKAPLADLVTILRTQTHHMHPLGHDLRAQVATYAAELKTVKVMNPDLDPVKFADAVVDDFSGRSPKHV